MIPVGALAFLCAASALFTVWLVVGRRRSWCAVEGRVDRSEPLTAGDPDQIRVVRLYYSFYVGTEYYAEHFVDIKLLTEASSEEFIAEFPTGTPLTVRYDSKNPNSSLIDPADNPAIASIAGTLRASWDDGAPGFPFDG